MQSTRPPRGPGSFSPLPPPSPSNPSASSSAAAAVAAAAASSSSVSAVSPTFDQPPRQAPTPPTRPRRDSPASFEDAASLSAVPSPLSINKVRQPLHYHSQQQQQSSGLSTGQTPPSAHSNFSRPTPVTAAVAAAAAARNVAAATGAGVGGSSGLNIAGGDTLRAVSPLTLPVSNGATSRHDGSGPISPISSFKPGHSRKHSQTAGLFDASLPSTSGGGSLSQVIKAQQQQPQPQQQPSRSMVNTPPLQPQQSQTPREMSASQIAAQAAVLNHKQAQQGSTKLTPQQQQQLQQAQQSQLMQQQQPYSQPSQHQQQHQQLLQHSRQRSQTVPVSGEPYDVFPVTNKRSSGGAQALAPPILSLTEASAPRESGFGNQTYHNGLLGSHTSAAQTAANVVFSRSGAPPSSPKMASPHSPKQQQLQQQQIAQHSQPSLPPLPAPPPPPPVPEKKPEKTKVKLFSRPGKISTKGEAKEKPLPSPSKMGITSALASLQRANFSTTSLDSSAQSFYSLANSSAATIRATDNGLGLGLAGTGSSATIVGGNSGAGAAPSIMEKETGKEKEKRHHFLSRQKHKLKDKDDFHLPLSSAASNSRPTDPHAPSSLYNFSLPPSSPGPNSTTFKSMSGLDLRHGGRALREKKKEDKSSSAAGAGVGADSSDLVGSVGFGGGFGGGAGGVGGVTGGGLQSEWPGPGSFGSAGGAGLLHDSAVSAVDAAKYGSGNLSYDDAWPYLKAKLQVIFEGEDLRIPVELLNRVVIMHIQYCIQRRSPNIILEDLRDLLTMGFASLDRTLRKTPEDRLIPALVELWLFTFTSILPYMQAVFLPLDLEFAGAGTLLTPEQARDFWGGVAGGGGTGTATSAASAASAANAANVAPVSAVLDVRRLVLASYRDTVILPRYDTLKPIFSRLSLEFLPQSLASLARGSPMSSMQMQTKPIPIQQRPGRSSSSLAAGGAPHSYGSFGSFGSSLQQQQQQQLLYSTSPGAESAGDRRPGTAMSLDPSMASSFSSSAATLNNNGNGGGGSRGGDDSGSASGSRSRAISNVSFGSGASAGEPRPSFSSSRAGDGGGGGGGSSTLANSVGTLGSLREQNVEDSKQVTEMVGRMLQCMSVLAGVGVAGEALLGAGGEEAISGSEGNQRVEELSRLLKLNWLGRGRTGRNRRGMVGGRVKRGGGGGGGAGEPLPATRQGLSVA